MRQRGLARARELSWEACARGTLEVYRETLGASDLRAAASEIVGFLREGQEAALHLIDPIIES